MNHKVKNYFSTLLMGLVLVSVNSVAFGTMLLPNAEQTPGKLCDTNNPNFAEYRYPAHIPYCRRNVSSFEKDQIAAKYGVPKQDYKLYEFDHLIPLAIGGSDDIENLWPQPLAQAHLKDRVEDQAFQLLRAGKITQDQAVKMIWDWFATIQAQ